LACHHRSQAGWRVESEAKKGYDLLFVGIEPRGLYSRDAGPMALPRLTIPPAIPK